MFGGSALAAAAARRAVCIVLCCGSLLCAGVRAGNAGSDASAKDSLPPYAFQYENGLYATIVGFVSVRDMDLKNQKSIKLNVDSFKKKMPVKAVIQRESAPLIVLLLGIDGQANGRLGKLWPSWYAQAGYHVLTFDSTFLPAFIETSGHGVTGNLVAESGCVKEIISSFLRLSEMRGKVTKIGIVGMSYGGIEALVLGTEAAAGKLPFTVDGIQAYSPPLRMQKTGELIDKWFEEDRWNYTLVELANQLSSHKPVGPDKPVPFSDSLMRAGIAAAFRLGLVDVIVRNDRTYKLHMLPDGNNFDNEYVKRDYAATRGYTEFMEEATFPYWQKRMGFKAIADLMGPIEVQNLLPRQPACSEIIFAQDDPFNTPEDVAAIRALGKGCVTILPRGGHLGFVNEAWTRAKLLRIFDGRQATCENNGPSTAQTK
jgi:predicted alpha/beta-fold hydrolase